MSKPFEAFTWVGIVFTLFLLCTFFLVAHTTYKSLGLGDDLVLPEGSRFNFFLYGFCKITEPEPLPWFRRAAAGSLAVTLWSVFALLLLMFYQSNLRAHLVTVDYEKPMATMQDVLDRGQKIWSINSAYLIG